MHLGRYHCAVGVVMAGIEALSNAVIGFAVSWAATWLVLGYTPTGSVAVSAMFFGLSFARSYILRKVFQCLTRG